MKVRFTIWASAFALSVALLSGCQSDDSGASETPPAAPPQMGGAPGGPVAGMPDGAPSLPVGPAPTQPTQVAKGTKPKPTSFDGAPEGMPGVTAGGAAGGQGIPGGIMPGGAAPSGGSGVNKPKPIVEGRMTKYRVDPFVSFVRLVIEKPPAYTLAVPERLAAYPKPPAPKPTTNPEEMLPLPQVPRRVAGVLYNGAITAILETGTPPASETRIIAPGAKVPSGVPGIPDLTVDSIALDRLVLRADDGRTVEVKLSGLAPAVLQSMQSQFGGATGGGGAPMGAGAPPGGIPGAGFGAGGAELK